MKRNRESMISVAVEPECWPKAVHWCLNGTCGKNGATAREQREKARKHLSGMGWKFWHARKGNRMELRFESPAGKLYFSLRTACKAFIDQGGGGGARGGGGGPRVSESVGSNRVSVDSSCNSRKTEKKRKIEHVCLVVGLEAGSPKKLKRGKKVLADMKRLRDHSKAGRRGLRSSKRAREDDPNLPRGRSPRTVLSWLIDHKVVLPDAKVHYRPRKDTPVTRGLVTREGIKCDCCSKVFTLTGFETHAGSTYHRPAANIILDQDGRTIMDCQRQMRNVKNEVIRSSSATNVTRGSLDDDQNDDICTVCRYGGELVLCDGCPSAFHSGCVGLDEVADGDWFCPSCCCGTCGNGKFQGGDDQNGNGGVVICDQCEHKYHIGCIRESNAGGVKLENNWVCSRKCEEVLLGLNSLLGKPIQVGPNNLTWTLLKSTSSTSTHSDVEDMTENYSKLNLALGVMHECFEPSKDPYTKRDMVEDIIFSRESELKRMNFKGFYTVILESNEELITVATVRVYREVAEVPLVATRFHYRRQGMCRVLMNELENQLMELGIERLTLPSVPGALQTWTGSSFGFKEMTAAERLQVLKYTFLDFQDTVMCHKVLKQSTTEQARPLEGNVEFDGGGAVSAITQVEEYTQDQKNGALDQRLRNLEAELASVNYDEMLLDLDDPNFSEWFSCLDTGS